MPQVYRVWMTRGVGKGLNGQSAFFRPVDRVGRQRHSARSTSSTPASCPDDLQADVGHGARPDLEPGLDLDELDHLPTCAGLHVHRRARQPPRTERPRLAWRRSWATSSWPLSATRPTITSRPRVLGRSGLQDPHAAADGRAWRDLPGPTVARRGSESRQIAFDRGAVN